MGAWVTTIVVEPRFLVREALASLMGNLSYRVVCSGGTTADISNPSVVGDGRKLVILGALCAEDAANEAVNVRKLWPDSKIMLLLESASCADLQKLFASQIDGCVPLFASADTLNSTLELIMVQDLRVMVVGGTKLRLMQGTQSEEADKPNRCTNKSLSNVMDDEAVSIAIADMPNAQAKKHGTTLTSAREDDGGMNGISSLRKLTLSEREAQILDGLVKGHANKVIARTCDISEATVKVHMKSILRKIRVANRTQAAIWALEHGYCGNEIRDRALKATPKAQEAITAV
jgi:two-component system nitrate/nitrite response regulator NarL